MSLMTHYDGGWGDHLQISQYLFSQLETYVFKKYKIY